MTRAGETTLAGLTTRALCSAAGADSCTQNRHTIFILRGLGSLGRNGFSSGSRRGRFGHGFYHRGSFLGRFGFNRCGNGGFLRCGFGFLRGVLAAAAHDDVALRTGALRINLFLFGKVVAQASGLL